VKLTDPAREAIERFRPDIRQEVAAELRRLGEDPRLGRPVLYGPLEGVMCFQFRVQRLPGVWRFTVLREFAPNEEDIWITAFGFLRGDPPRLDAP
jgi:hypothetical protein